MATKPGTGTMFCQHCGTEFTYILWHARRAPRRYCSAACKRAGYRGTAHYHWTDESTLSASGYRIVRVPHNHVSATTGRRKRKGRALEHILVAEQALGRPLRNGEVVHRINCDKLDNRNSNLLICSREYHAWLHGEMSRRWAQEHLGAA